jgi:Rieske Fe-S protein
MRIERDQTTIPPDGRPLEEEPVWRRDFPIDWPQDHYVARRDFTRFLGLTSLAFAVGQLWIAFQNYNRRKKGLPEIRRIGSLSDIPAGGVLSFSYPDAHDPCILIRPSAEVLLGYSQKCTHLSCAVVPLPGAEVLHCPCHEGYFDLRTGRPLAGPPRRPLPTIRLSVRGEDIYAEGVERKTL